MEIPSSHAGVVKALKVQLGSKVSKGTPIAVIEAAGGAAGGRRAPTWSPKPDRRAPRRRLSAVRRGAGAAASERTAPTAALPPTSRARRAASLPHASPSIRKSARELGVPLEEVKGTGRRAASRRPTSQASSRP
jgi:pyruvate dehydrogenase E2 component (dihydrolipoamide acetyltransferase)